MKMVMQQGNQKQFRCSACDHKYMLNRETQFETRSPAGVSLVIDSGV